MYTEAMAWHMTYRPQKTNVNTRPFMELYYLSYLEFRHGSSNHFKIETKVMPKHSVCNSSEYIDLLKGILCNSFKHIYSITQRHYMIFVPKSKPLIKTLLTPLLKRSYVIVIPLSKCHASWLICQQKCSLIFKNDK